MNGIDLINNLLDELNRAKEMLLCYIDEGEIMETFAEELINDIRADLDRFYDISESIYACVEDIEVE